MSLVKKTVDEWLNGINYTIDPGYIPSEFALEFISFIKLVNAENGGEEHKTPVIHYHMLDTIAGKKENIANMCSRGLSKALDVNTSVMTPNGYIAMGDLLVGDRVIDRNGQPTEITHISEEFTNQCYTVQLTDGSSFVANGDHLHVVQRRTQAIDSTKPRKASGRQGTKNIWVEEVLTTSELLQKGVTATRQINEKHPTGMELKWFIPLITVPIEFESEGCALDPYTVGVILGDGHIDKKVGVPTIFSHIDDVGELCSYLPYVLSEIHHDTRRYTTTDFRIRGIGLLVKQVIGTNTTWTKSIPNELLFGSVQERIEVLRGLLDTDGTISKSGSASFCSASEGLAYGVVHIVKSLGGNARISHYTNEYAGYYNVSVVLATICPFKLKRKANLWRPNKHYKSGKRVGIQSILPIPNITSKCISVDSPTKTYLIENSIITHNTSLLGEYLFLYIAVYGGIPGFGNVNYALYVSDSIENGVKKMRLRLERRCTNSAFLRKYITFTKFTDIRWYFKNTAGKEFVVSGHGSTTGVRGTQELGTRPHLAVLDDLVSDADARSPTIIESIENTVYKAIDYALHPNKRKVIWSGTPFNAKDPLYKAIESGAWHVNVYPVCETFPCSRENFKGAWEDRFNYDYVNNQYQKSKLAGKLDAFNQELMLRIMAEEDRLINDSDIIWYKRRNVLQNKGAYNFYITTDFATSDKEHADFSVLNVWAYNNNGDWMWVDGVCKRMLMNESVDHLFRLAQEYIPQEVGIETAGQQGGFISWIQTEMGNRNIYFTLSSGKGSNSIGIRPTKDKMSRFQQNAVPLFKAKKIWFPEELKDSDELVEMLAEISLATGKQFKSSHDDQLDNLSMLAELNAWKPSEVSTPEADKEVPGLSIWDDDIQEQSSSSYFV